MTILCKLLLPIVVAGNPDARPGGTISIPSSLYQELSGRTPPAVEALDGELPEPEITSWALPRYYQNCRG